MTLWFATSYNSINTHFKKRGGHLITYKNGYNYSHMIYFLTGKIELHVRTAWWKPEKST